MLGWNVPDTSCIVADWVDPGTGTKRCGWCQDSPGYGRISSRPSREQPALFVSFGAGPVYARRKGFIIRTGAHNFPMPPMPGKPRKPGHRFPLGHNGAGIDDVALFGWVNLKRRVWHGEAAARYGFKARCLCSGSHIFQRASGRLSVIAVASCVDEITYVDVRVCDGQCNWVWTE